MSKKFLTHINLNGNQLINASFEKLSADPVSGNFEGRMYYNTTSDTVRTYDGTAWIAVGAITSVVGTTDEVNVSTEGGVATVSLPATINADTTGSAARLTTARAIQLSGDVTGTANFDGSAAINISATIAANSVALGTDTTGNYVASVSTSDGISGGAVGSEGAVIALTNTDKGSSQNIFKNVSVNGTTIVADNNDDTLTVAAGTGIGVAGNATTDTLTISNTGVTSLAGTANQIAASGSTGSVTLSLPSAVTFPGSVTLNADPTTALGAATKQYVDSIAQGLHVHASVSAATTANVTLTDAPGTIDGVTLVNQMRVLVKNQSNASQNGIYVYDSATNDLLRASDFDSAAEIQGGDFVFVTGGTLYDNTGWVQTEKVTTLGTDPITFVQFSGAGTYTAGNGLTLTGSSFSINTAITADVNSVQTLTNKTLTSPTITSPTVSGLYLSDNNIVIEGTADAFETTLTFTDPTADRTITFKNESGTVALLSDVPAAYTDEQAQDAVGTILTDSSTIDFTYTDGTPSITAAVKLATTSYLVSASGLGLDIGALDTALKSATYAYTRKYSSNIGNSEDTTLTVTHSLGTKNVQVQVYDNTTFDTVECDVVRDTDNTVQLSFTTAPSGSAYRVVVIG